MREAKLIDAIRDRSERLRGLDAEHLLRASAALKYRASCGESTESLIPDSFALVVESTRRSIGLVHHDVQLLCGIQLVRGHVAEMKTGEGKTLTASLAAYLFGLFGQGVHVVTFNDYLASRDSEFVRPILAQLAMAIATVTEQSSPDERRLAYAADVTYGAAREFGFDFLRDRLAIEAVGAESGLVGQAATVMRGLHYAVIDEADSILIDEARTPLIIGVVDRHGDEVAHGCCRWAALHADKFVERIDYQCDQVRQDVKLTSLGMHKLREITQTDATGKVSIRRLVGYVQNAIKVSRDFRLDKTYAIRDDDIVILDEYTGRPAEGRQWQRGIHQAVQAKEDLPISPATKSAAAITVQTFYKRYRQFCGMTGTAWTSRHEFKKVFVKKVKQIPTHRPVQRKQCPVQVFHSADEKFKFVAQQVSELLQAGRAVLVGTRSVRASDKMSQFLKLANIEHQVLNARFIEQEAEIIAKAGRPGAVTVATNMAGRGTDIKLDESVKAAGGLHVILTEIHSSERIDWQLIGRCSRQGDPGSYQICVSLEDEILQLAFGTQYVERLQAKCSQRELDSPALFRSFKKAQRKIERQYLVDRLIVQKQDEHRKEMSFETGQDQFLTTVVS